MTQEFSEDHIPECGYIHFDFELSALGNTSPGIHSLEVFKKIIAKIAKSPGDTMYLPIQGYVYDTTVTEGNAQVPVGRDGSFYHIKSIDSPVPSATIYLSCRNVIGEEAELDFSVEIIESENEIWDVYCDYGEGPETLVPDEIIGDFHFNTGLMEITISGKYFGLTGAVCGYETYNVEDTSFESPLKSGVFTTIVDSSVYTGPDLGTGYEAGYFTDEPVKLVPNDQVLVIYVENPGGVRYEYRSDEGDFPVFNYQMPEEDQMVVFDAEYEIDETINDIHYTHRTEVPAEESPAPPYVFTAQSAIKGEVLTIEQLDEIRVLCSTPGLVFENGENEMTVALRAGNKFQVPFSIVMANFGTQQGADPVIVEGVEKVYNPKADMNSDGRINGEDHRQASFITQGEIYDIKSFSYDRNGNRTYLVQNGDIYRYSYGERNHLMKVECDFPNCSHIFYRIKTVRLPEKIITLPNSYNMQRYDQNSVKLSK